jgi:hypothetical protein
MHAKLQNYLEMHNLAPVSSCPCQCDSPCKGEYMKELHKDVENEKKGKREGPVAGAGRSGR